MERYHVQHRMLGVRELSEDELVAWLRYGHLDGRELVRTEGEETWRPLYELPAFAQAVPHVGDPRDAVRRRIARGLGWHLLVYAIVAGGLLGVSTLPALLWGVFVVIHATQALPSAWSLAREGKLLRAGSSAAALPGATATALPAPAAAVVEEGSGVALPPGSDVDALLADVRSLLARNPSNEASKRLDGVAASLGELRGRIAKLSALLTAQDRGALEERLAGARRALEQASDPADEPLRRREVEVLRESLAADERARKALERLELRERLTLQELQQLRLDLTRLEADAPGPEDLGERLEQIRLEAEASAEVDALIGGRA